MKDITRAIRRRAWIDRALAFAAVTVAMGALATPAAALPSYARQTGQPCAMCHVGFPELTPFGREFKLNGYVQGGGEETWIARVAAMVVAGFELTEAKQPGSPAPHFAANDNVSIEQVSLFYGGKIVDNLGAFAQVTYDGIGRRFSWDNLDLRYANQGTLFGSDLTWGVSLNNNPTVQDVWNTTPAWGFPFQSSGLAPSPAAASLIDGGLGGQSLGLGAYAWWNNMLYAEISGYRNLSISTERVLGVDTTGTSSLDGIAPYWRLALEPKWGMHSLEVGTYGLYANVNPGRITQFGQDHITDIGVDAQYQYSGEDHGVSLQLNFIREFQNLHASRQIGGTNGNNVLDTFRAKASYFYRHTYGLNVSWFNISGTQDAAIFGSGAGMAPNNSPNSDGWILEANYLPFSYGGPSWWPWLNARFGLQYTIYNHFNGSTTNVDSAGRKATQNNTLFLYSMIMF
jgi:hypothetical protein